MDASAFDSVAREIAINTIDAYKTYLSPLKGFSCPHRLLHKRESCSDYVKSMFSTESFTDAIFLSGSRFQQCAEAAQNLRKLDSSGGCIILPCCLPI